MFCPDSLPGCVKSTISIMNSWRHTYIKETGWTITLFVMSHIFVHHDQWPKSVCIGCQVTSPTFAWWALRVVKGEHYPKGEWIVSYQVDAYSCMVSVWIVLLWWSPTLHPMWKTMADMDSSWGVPKMAMHHAASSSILELFASGICSTVMSSMKIVQACNQCYVILQDCYLKLFLCMFRCRYGWFPL